MKRQVKERVLAWQVERVRSSARRFIQNQISASLVSLIPDLFDNCLHWTAQRSHRDSEGNYCVFSNHGSVLYERLPLFGHRPRWKILSSSFTAPSVYLPLPIWFSMSKSSCKAHTEALIPTFKPLCKLLDPNLSLTVQVSTFRPIIQPLMSKYQLRLTSKP